jgi:WS/DGAT/MGAT family acyltransferase
MRQVRARDAVYLYAGDNQSFSTALSCTTIAGADGGPLHLAHDEVVEWARQRVAISDQFRSKMVQLPLNVGLPYWVPDPDFSVSDHVVIHDGDIDWAGAKEVMTTAVEQPFDLSKPPWTLHVIPNVTGLPGEDRVVTIVGFRFHHVAFDGLTLVKLLSKMFSDDPVVPIEFVGSDTASRTSLTMREIRRMPAQWVRVSRALLQEIRRNRRREPQPPARVFPATRFNRPLVGRRNIDFVEFERSDVAELQSRIPGLTVNDVLLSVIGEALKRHLAQSGEIPDGSIAALSPISTRKMYDDSSSNQFSLIVVDLHIDQPDLGARLGEISAGSKAEKERVAEWSKSESKHLMNLVPAPALRRIMRVNYRSMSAIKPEVPFNIVVSNVHTEQETASTIMGMSVRQAWALAPLGAGATLAHTVADYRGKLVVAVTVDSDVMPDLAPYRVHLLESMATHLAHTSEESAG